MVIGEGSGFNKAFLGKIQYSGERLLHPYVKLRGLPPPC
jgi:hypothetical protein